MDPSGTAALYAALRGAGLHAPGVLKRLPDPAPTDPTALADALTALGVLTPFQARKLRMNRLSDVLIGQYFVVDKVGEGGMGKVYKAVQLRTGRIVALKIVRPQLLTNPVIMRRYQREAAAAAALAHPNIVGLYDADEAGGKHFMAMEFVDGSDLARMVKTFGPLEFAEGCEYIRQAALGLQHAHDAGLVHRDIKPSNLLVCGERAIPGTGGVAVVKVLDMGLVRNLADAGVEESEVTRDGTVVGTPDYMAPEQAKNSSSVGPAADLYSLGCTLYFLFTGRAPFTTGTAIEKLLQHQIDRPPDPRKFRPDLPYPLTDLILKLLAKTPQERPPSAADVAERLRPFAEGRSDGLGITDLRLPPRPPAPPSEPHRALRVAPGSTMVLEPAPTATKKAKPLPPRPAPAAPPVPAPDAFASEEEEEIFDAEPIRFAAVRPETRREPAKPKYLWPAVGIGTVVVLVAIGAAVSGRKPATVPPPEAPPVAAVKPSPGPAVGPLAVEHLLPDKTAAVIIADPRAYFAAFKTDIRTDSRLAGAIARLDRDFSLPLEKADRAVVAFPADGGVVAAVEGSFVTPTLADEQARSPAASGTKVSGIKLAAFPTGWKNYFGGVAGGRSAVIGTPAEAVAGVVARGAVKGPAGTVVAVPADAGKTLLTFAADGRYLIPGVGALSDLKLKGLIARFRVNDRKIEGDFELTAATREQLQDFVSLTAFGKLVEKYPGLKPVLDPFRDDALRNYEDGPGGVTLRLRGAWDIADVHLWIEDYLPKP